MPIDFSSGEIFDGPGDDILICIEDFFDDEGDE